MKGWPTRALYNKTTIYEHIIDQLIPCPHNIIAAIAGAYLEIGQGGGHKKVVRVTEVI